MPFPSLAPPAMITKIKLRAGGSAAPRHALSLALVFPAMKAIFARTSDGGDGAAASMYFADFHVLDYTMQHNKTIATIK